MVSNKSNMNSENSKGHQIRSVKGSENAKKAESKENSAAVVNRSDNEDEEPSSVDGQEAPSEEEIPDGSSSEESEEDESEEEDDDLPRKKKAKLGKHDDGSSGFSTAVNAILGSHLKAHDRKDPIMARKRGVVKKLESDKLEQKAKRALLAEKKKLLNKTRKKDIIPTVSAESESGAEIRDVLEKERRLRKIAQKGVVKLFNAILSTQVKTEKEGAEKLSEVKNRAEKKELLAELSKEKFLDLVKAAGDS